MADFRVWDELNGDEDCPRLVKAASAYGAAIAYAERDCDGYADGLYRKSGGELHSLRDGQPISVRDEAGELHRFRVGVIEFVARFAAIKADVFEKAGEP